MCVRLCGLAYMSVLFVLCMCFLRISVCMSVCDLFEDDTLLVCIDVCVNIWVCLCG